MTLLTPTTAASAKLASHAQSIAAHLASAAAHANAQAQTLLALDDASLAAWLNAQPPAEVESLFTAHATLGHALNAARAAVLAVLESSGIPTDIPAVDIRPVPEKLAAQHRVIAFADGVWSVTTNAPEPEPSE